MVNTINKYCVNNDCYNSNRKLDSVSYLIVHSTAVYPTVIRAAKGENNWFTRWNKPGIQKLAHGFIDDTGVYQFAPENMRCWHIGNTWGNSNCIGYELCEFDEKKEFIGTWNNAVELYALLCVKYGLKSDKVIGHCEAHDKGFATNHSDPVPYFKMHGRTMNDFRNDVKRRIASLTATPGKVIDCDELNIRQSPNGKVLAAMPKGAKLYIIGAGTDSDGDNWHEIIYKNMTGFAWPRYISFKGIVNDKESLNFRRSPNGEIIKKIPDATPIDITGIGYDSEGSMWYKAEYQGVTGYVWPGLIRLK